MLGSNPGLLQLWHWQSAALTTRLDRLDLSHTLLNLFHTWLDLIHTRLDLFHYKFNWLANLICYLSKIQADVIETGGFGNQTIEHT
jgi:hypothetical protein